MELFTTEEVAHAMETSPDPQHLATCFRGPVRSSAAAVRPTTTGPRCAVVVLLDPDPMAHTPVAVADPPTTTGPRCAVVVLLDPDPMAHTLVAVADPRTTTGPRCVVGVL